MYSRSIKAISLIVLVAFSAGCAKSNDNDQPIQDRTSRGLYTPPAPQVDSATGRQIPVETSYVVGSNSDPAAYQAMIKNLVLPQIDPQYLGNVDSSTGVVMEAFVSLNKVNGSVIPSQSRVVLQIRDEYTGAVDSGSGQPIPPVTMVIAGASGTYSGGALRMLFQDCAGQVEIQGSVSGQYFTGNVFFTNNKKADCSTSLPGAPQRYFLGTFQVQTCGFMTCQ